MIILFVIINLFNNLPCNSQESNLKIDIETFNNNVKDKICLMTNLDTINSIEYAIEITRLYNTIQFNDRFRGILYETYSKLFYNKHIDNIVKILKATVSKGMAYYSSEFDLYIGGSPQKNSMYEITN